MNSCPSPRLRNSLPRYELRCPVPHWLVYFTAVGSTQVLAYIMGFPVRPSSIKTFRGPYSPHQSCDPEHLNDALHYGRGYAKGIIV